MGNGIGSVKPAGNAIACWPLCNGLSIAASIAPARAPEVKPRRARPRIQATVTTSSILTSMQLLSSYLLETPSLSADELTVRAASVRECIAEWLRKDKEVADPWAASGDFESLTRDGSGSFSREQLVLPSGTLEEVRLEEFTRGGQIFTTYIATVSRADRLRVYCTLNVANAESVVAPLPIDPRCPSIVRTLINQCGQWQINGSPVPPSEPRPLVGDSGGRTLAVEIRKSSRSLPIIVISGIEGEQLWPRLADGIAYDLAGLASVVVVDDEATWALSDEVGKLHSCYRGAVRLYWPPRLNSEGETYFNSTVWTASVLLSNDRDGKGQTRFRSTLRRTLMSTAALSITPPPAIRELRDADAQLRIEDLEKRADPNSKELAEARRLSKENQELKAKVEQLQSELAKTAARADSAQHALNQLKAPSIDVEEDVQAESESTDPEPGETRFYKKTHSKSAYDVLVPVEDCGHTSWQASNKADKAKKGLERLLRRSDWKSVQHCGTCTGGGMWKVRW
jgi:hypothetical protein